MGGWLHRKYFHAEFPQEIKETNGVHINELEALALIVAVKKWITDLENKNMLMHCNNQATMEIVNTGRAKNRYAQACLRELCYLTAMYNTVIKVVHQRGQENRICDYLSRWHLDPDYAKKFKEITTGFVLEEYTVEKSDFLFMHDWWCISL